MKEKLKEIIDNYFNNDESKYKLLLDEDLLIILDNELNESDFFHFIYDEEENIKNIDSKNIYERLIENDNNNLFKNIESFEKNLNFIYFIRLGGNDYINEIENSELKKISHGIEENPYYAKEKVIFYTDELVNGLDIEVNIDNTSNLEEYVKKSKNKFKLDLLIGLSFMKIDFGNNTEIEKTIFKDSFKQINNEYNILDIKTELLSDYNSFNKQIKFINEIENILELEREPLGLTNLEENLLNLFGNGKEELEEKLNKNLIALNKLKDENK